MTSQKSVTFLIFAGSVFVEIWATSDFVDLRPDLCRGWASHQFCTNGVYSLAGTNIPRTQCTLCPETCKQTCQNYREEIPEWQAEYQAGGGLHRCVLLEILSAKKSSEPNEEGIVLVDLRPEDCQVWALTIHWCTNKFYLKKGTDIPWKTCILCPKTCIETCKKWSAEIPKWQATWDQDKITDMIGK
ncbi:hypothetical protein DdX_12561 [Ditylenchus destructor]|uniref:Secreted protein n=1 Tax=Ditylenchus destructor TaxID=166010 RepID=A0AAD4R3J2_9BILA|nr:hypothetical protein DdX_12561 [Ditylenchus destructor]